LAEAWRIPPPAAVLTSSQRAETDRGDAPMKNIAFWVVIAFGLITGTAVVMTHHPHHAEADCTGTGC